MMNDNSGLNRCESNSHVLLGPLPLELPLQSLQAGETFAVNAETSTEEIITHFSRHCDARIRM